MPSSTAMTVVPTGLLGQAQLLLPEMSAALRSVAERLLADPARVAQSTIVELAESSGTSSGTVTRFCRALGLRGYADLRFALATEAGRAESSSMELEIGTDIADEDDLDKIRAIITAADTRALRETSARLDMHTIERVVAAIAAARRVDIYGVGGSATVAEEMALRLCCIGILSSAWSEVHNGLTSAALLDTGDVALGISNSGRTRETVEMLAEARGNGATAIALTGFAGSPLTLAADHVLTTAVQELSFRPRALAARHAQLIVLDLVFVGVAQRRYGKTTDALRRTSRAIEPHRTPTGQASSKQRQPRSTLSRRR